MKLKFKTTTTFFVMVVLALGFGSSLSKEKAPLRVSAETKEIIITAAKMGYTGTQYFNETATIDGVVFSSENVSLKDKSTEMQFKASDGKLGNTSAIPGTLTKVSFSQTGTARAFTLSGGTSASSLTSEGSQTATNLSWDLTGKNYTFFSITRGANAAYVPQIVVEYEPTPTKELLSISVITAPTKTNYYVGELFDETGMVVTATFDTGDEVVVPTINKVPLVATDTEVEVSYTYGGITKTASVPITVTARVLTGLRISKNPDTMTYKIGQTFNPAGMVIDAQYNEGPDVSNYSNYEVLNGTFTSQGTHDVTIRSTENSEISVVLTVDVIDKVYGTYTLRQKTNTYNANPTLADFNITKSNALMDDFTMVSASNFRISSSPATTKTTIGRNATEGGHVTFTFPEEAIVTEVKLNAIEVDDDKTPVLKINDGVTFTYSEGKETIILKPYANTITLSTEGTSRIWFYDAEFTIKNAADAALDYGQFFLDHTADQCSALAVATATWEDLRLAYEFADTNVKALIDEATPLESGTALEEALLRYHYIAAKYGYTDFLEKGIVPFGRIVNNDTIFAANTNIPLVVIAFSVITFIAIALYKRRIAK